VASLEAHAAFLASHLTVCLGRHAVRSGLLQELAGRGGLDLAELAGSGALHHPQSLPVED